MLQNKTPGTYYVRESAREEIPERFRVFEPKSRDSSEGFFSQIKWTKKYTVWKLKSISPSREYSGFLEVVYEIVKP